MRSESRWPGAERDTLTVLTAEKRQVKIRLHGVDDPETGPDYGTRAKRAASELAFGKQVTIRQVDTQGEGWARLDDRLGAAAAVPGIGLLDYEAENLLLAEYESPPD